MLEAVSIAALLLIGAVLVFAATRPDGFRVARSVRIQAPPERIFPLIGDFRRWSAWSPWERKDPGMKRSYGGVPEGRGATYAWQGNGNVGQGRMEITEATPPRRVAIQLDFVKPFEAHNTVLFTLRPEGGSTEVTWEMQGRANYLAKLIGLFMSMDRMVGKDFEAGLANLRSAVEK